MYCPVKQVATFSLIPGLACPCRLLQNGDLLKQINLICPVQSSFAKISPFPFHPNHFYIPRRPTPLEGRIAIVTDAGRDAVDAAASGV